MNTDADIQRFESWVKKFLILLIIGFIIGLGKKRK
jgi:hypothetical protein